MTIRRSGIKSRIEWEKLNFEHEALQVVKRLRLPQETQAELDHQIQQVACEIQSKKKKVGIFVRFGCKSVLFFLKNTAYIERMKHEMSMRRRMRQNGEDMQSAELDDEVLRAHCQEQATAIFERNNQSGAGNWSSNYRYIRYNYTETMGRACLAAESALMLIKIAHQQHPQPQSPSPSRPLMQSSEKAQQEAQSSKPFGQGITLSSNWRHFRRTSEAAVDRLLGNKCDDYVPDDSDEGEEVDSTPQKITRQTYYQPSLFETLDEKSRQH